MVSRYIFLAIYSFFISVILVSLCKRMAEHKKILLAQGVPLVGGIAMGLALALGSAIFFVMQGIIFHKALGIILASLVMLALGIIDDWQELSIKAKLITQLVAASVLILCGIRTEIIYIGSIANIIITFIWLIGITNAFNHLDVLDGLAGAIAVITCAAFAFISFLNSDAQALMLCLGLLGAVAGFLFYNLPPAKVYMGNAGSHFLGFFLAAVAIGISYAPMERKVALISPILILGLPIFDTSFLIIMRRIKKKNPFLKSNDHLTLRFLKSGASKKIALCCILLLALLYALSGIFLSQVSNNLGLGIILCLIVLSLLIAFRLSKVSIDG